MAAILNGVNLGGWLVLEKWITPSLFSDSSANDEFSLCIELREQANEKLALHRETFIRAEDFDWIAAHGLNAVRIPIGHHIFGDAPPYVSAIETLDFAMNQARKSGLQVIIDLHTAPGSQNGLDHSGQAGKIQWHKSLESIDKTLEVISKLAERYSSYDNLYGIELLNEPHSSIPHSILVHYYEEGYERVRRYCKENVAVIIHDAFQPFSWSKDLTGEGYLNVILDAHLYQAFDRKDRKMDMHKHLKKTKYEWGELVDKVQQSHPMIVGEWSLGLDPKSLRGLDVYERNLALKAFGTAQINTFNKTNGWFFWTYKTEDYSGWSYRESTKLGYLPKLLE